jgi:FkbM family methyltransferase
MIPAAAWVAYRQARRGWYTALGRNPLVRGEACPTRDFELRSIRGLLESRSHKARILRTDEAGFLLWSTSLGELWTPPGANAHFVGMVAGEMNAGVYDISSLPNGITGCIVVDAGSNVGAFSRWVLAQGAQKVICFEPSPQTVECLRRNLAAEIAAGRAVVISKGLWDAPASLSFDSANAGNPGGHHIVAESTGSVTVAVTTLDEVTGELGLDRLDYIKMDIEGAEQRAITGASRTLERFRPQMCVATEHTDDMFANARAVIDKVLGLGLGYKYKVTESHPYLSPSVGSVLTPYSVLFHIA